MSSGTVPASATMRSSVTLPINSRNSPAVGARDSPTTTQGWLSTSFTLYELNALARYIVWS